MIFKDPPPILWLQYCMGCEEIFAFDANLEKLKKRVPECCNAICHIRYFVDGPRIRDFPVERSRGKDNRPKGDQALRHSLIARSTLEQPWVVLGGENIPGPTDPQPAVAVEEYFEFLVEEVLHDTARIRTRSSAGEEGVAFLPYDKMPEGERRYVEVGAPGRISVLVRSRGGTVRRTSEVRFLRPHQWKFEESSSAVDILHRRLKALLDDSRSIDPTKR